MTPLIVWFGMTQSFALCDSFARLTSMKSCWTWTVQGLPGREFTPMTVALTDAIFFFRNIDLQGKRECSDDISSPKCDIKTPLMSNIQNDRLRHSPDPLAGYHFSVSLIPPGGTLDIIASGFRLETREGGS